MNSLLNGPRRTQNVTPLYLGLYWLLTPIRLVRQRTAINLTASYVAVAVLTAALLLSVLYAMIFWPPLGRMFGLQNLTMDATLGEAARSYSHWLDPEEVATLLDGPGADAELTSRLDQIVSGDVPGFDTPMESDVPRVDHAALVTLQGDIVATDDPAWLATGARVTDFERATTREVAARSLMLNGLPDPAWGDLYSMAVVDERTSAAFPLITDDGEVVIGAEFQPDHLVDFG